MIRHRLLIAAALSVGMAGLGGCISVLPKTQPAQLYRFGVEDAASPSTGPKLGVTLLATDFPRASQGDGILTVDGARTAYIGGGRWAVPAMIQFREAAEQAFAAHAVRTELLTRGDLGRSEANLKIDVTSFEARYHGGGAPLVVVALKVRLSGVDGKVLVDQPVRAERPAAANRTGAIVDAFDAATKDALAQVVSLTDGKVQGRTPS